MPFNVPNNTNFSPYISPWAITSNDANPGEAIYTELARSFVPLVGNSPLTELFPEEMIPERVVRIDQSFEAAATIMPLVDWSKPDVVTGGGGGFTRSMMVQPLVVRNTKAIAHGAMNIRLKPGTANEMWSPQEQVEKIVSDMVKEHNLTWDVFRAMMLLGGISYTDPRTGVNASVSAQIPPHNVWKYNNFEGYQNRPEASIFLQMQDANQPEPNSMGVPWTHPNADILGTVNKLAMWFRTTNKSRITAMYMSADLAHILKDNNQIKLSMGGTAFGLPTRRSAPIVRETPEPSFAGNFTMNSEGFLDSIGGIPVRVVDTSFKDPVRGIFRMVFPKNKIVLVSEVDPNGQNEPPGRTQYCVSEEAGGAPGLWTRVIESTLPPAPPGMYIQMGNAGMPYLKYPYRVAHLTVASVNDINKRQGVQGDLQFGVF